MVKIIEGDCLEILPDIISVYGATRRLIIVSDPPFNIGYHYNKYRDKMPEDNYYEFIGEVFSMLPSVVVHYPESLYKLSYQMGLFPDKVVSWCYNSNTPRQHRDIAFFNIKPDFTKVTQPYKNPNDKRIKKRIAEGKKGGRLYDWWNINQVKNVSKVKTNHPCQMPLEVMTNIIGILPEDAIIIDPFSGSGTTGVACKKLNRDFIGIEIDPDYVTLSLERLTGVEI